MCGQNFSHLVQTVQQKGSTSHRGLYSKYPLEREKKRTITRNMVSNCLKAVAVKMGLPGGDYASHSARIGAATSLLHAGADPHAIRLMGRWSKFSDCWALHSRYSLHLMKGVALDMVSVHTAGATGRAPECTIEGNKKLSPQIGTCTGKQTLWVK